MNKRKLLLLKGLLLVSIFFYFLYFANYTWSNTANNNAQELAKMHYTRGVKLYKQAEYDAAILELQSALYIDPSNVSAKKYLLAAQKRRDKSIVNKLYVMADGYYKQNQYQKSLETYEKVLEVIPNDGYALYKVELLKAKVEKMEMLKQSSSYKQRAQELEGLEKEVLASDSLLSKAKQLEQERLEQAKIEQAQRKLDTELVEEKRTSEIAEDLENIEEARQEEEKVSLAAISVAPEAKEEVRIAKVTETKVETKPSVRQEDRVSLPSISVAPAAKEEAKAVNDLNKIEKEMAMAQEAKQEDIEKQSKSMYDLGKEYYGGGDYARAISVFRQIVALEDQDNPKYSDNAKRYIAKAEQKMAEQARNDQRDKGKQRTGDIKSLYTLGRGYYNDQDYPRAISLFEQIVQLEKDSTQNYTPNAKKYIQTAKAKIDKVETEAREESRSDRIKEVWDKEEELMDDVIDMAKEAADYKMSTENKEVSAYSPPTPYLIQQKLLMPVSMNFQNVDVVSVLNYLAETTGANIVMSNAVTESPRTVNIKVKDMTLDEALKYVLKSAGLQHRIDKDVIWVAAPDEIQNEEMETKIFTLKKGKGSYTMFSSPTTGGVGLGSAADISEESNIKDTIEKAVNWPSGAKIVLDDRLGALIVTNTPYNLDIIERILEKIDVDPIQVLIETRFLEVTVTDLSELGIDWKLNSDLATDKGKSGMYQGIMENSGTNFTDTSRSTEGFNLTYQGVLTRPQFQLVLHTLDESQKVKTLSAPRVTTLDNQTATMKIVDEWIYPTRYEFQIVQNDVNGDGDFNDAGETQYKNVPADFVKRDVGILLRVTPSVGINDDSITLTLIPEVSEGTAGYFSYTGDVTLPLFTSRNLSTSVVVKNGDTVVLGGLVKESQTKVETKVPILGDLPWLGALFRKDTDTTVRKNLLIFVTASILTSSGNRVVLNKVAQPVVK